MGKLIKTPSNSDSVSISKTTKKVKKSKSQMATIDEAKLVVKTPKTKTHKSGKMLMEFEETIVETIESKTPKTRKIKTPKVEETVVEATKTKTPKTPKMKRSKVEEPKVPEVVASPIKASKKQKKVKTPKIAKAPSPEPESDDAEMASENEDEDEEEAAASDDGSDEDMASDDHDEADPAPVPAKKVTKPKKDDTERVSNRSQEHKLYIGNLNFQTKVDDLTLLFKKHGGVTNVFLPNNKGKKQNMGFGFVFFAKEEDMNKVLEATIELDGRKLVMNIATSNKRKRDDEDGASKAKKTLRLPNSVFAARLNESSTVASIKKHFSQFGKVVRVDLPMRSDMRGNKHFCFVAFAEQAAMKVALSTQDQKLDGSDIKVAPMKEKEAAPRAAPTTLPNEIFFNKLAPRTTQASITSHFSKYGAVTRVTLSVGHVKNTSKGFGFLAFATEEAMKAALKEKKHKIDGIEIAVRLSNPKEAEKKRPSKIHKGPEKKRRKVEVEEANEEKGDDVQLEQNGAEDESDDDSGVEDEQEADGSDGDDDDDDDDEEEEEEEDDDE